ncbi:MAG: transcriptional regulator NrdR [Candidatus Margulisbacteria bacterium]|nr:transcriptional regulator NrdR [Candidatus Margulisiibacteriota bacterium]MBU1021775.1 transcriptional regulator NrdR [Candidatus Margulisiibacteriota bacterium]MBU1729521.1 transcriptional regulator NrdR [Candidatus Margulisiibacteriota bacterium]MBU1955378.1 transcriptional regulator NrdR [Candidatus Margulisiibacteriota bacterium]
MKCPFCGFEEDKVLESRETEEGKVIRRRRECQDCEGRFTSYERIEEAPLMVIKREGTREQFDINKVLKGVTRACEKRPVSSAAIQNLVEEIEKIVRREGKREIPAAWIGDLVMERLQKIDQIAYVRYASVYRNFSDVTQFLKEIRNLSSKNSDRN